MVTWICCAPNYFIGMSTVALSEIEIKRCEKSIAKFLENNRPPVHIRSQMDIKCALENQTVTVFQVEPKWDEPNVILEHAVAKTTYVRTQNIWKVYWKRQDMKWHSYQPVAHVRSLEMFFDVVANDEY